MNLKLLIIGCLFHIIGLFVFFGSWGARFLSLIDTSLLAILNWIGFSIMLVGVFIILISIDILKPLKRQLFAYFKT